MKENIKEGTKDVQEKRTIFVRNISYDTKEDDLKEAFSKYGEIKYCKLCYDRDFERPKGTAFIQFVDADGALNACGESNILEIDSRKIQIDLAISRKQINDIIVDKKTKIPEDRRNITLAKEGFIDPKTSEGQRLSKSDLNMRAKIEAANSAKLKLLHYFVSTTRLSVHNLPVKCTDSELKKVFLNVFKDDKDARIVECRIMRDLKRVNSEGIAKSRGYGFVQFTKFEHARKALHLINNNPNVFDDKKTRLIVQFSIEDMRALKKKERRVEKEVHKRERNTGHGHNKTVSKPTAAKKNKKNDPQDDLDENKKREKNLLRLNILEKKLKKRKLKDAKTQDNGKPIGHTAKPATKPNNANSIDKIMQMRNNKRMKNKRKRENLNRKLNSQKGDKVDNLIDKYIKDKNKPKQKKWYDK
jgi:nucleolar protein 4